MMGESNKLAIRDSAFLIMSCRKTLTAIFVRRITTINTLNAFINISILYGTSLKHIARLQRIQHAAARVVMNQHSRTSQLSSSELLKQLHWLPIEWRIRFKLATLTFKALRTMVTRHIFLTSCNTTNP